MRRMRRRFAMLTWVCIATSGCANRPRSPSSQASQAEARPSDVLSTRARTSPTTRAPEGFGRALGLDPDPESERPALVRGLLSAFPRGESSTLGGPFRMQRQLSHLVSRLSPRAALAFVVDREGQKPLMRALSLAVAAQRGRGAKLEGALVSFGGTGGARAETGFVDALELLRVAQRTDWEPNSFGVGTSWLGLALVTKLQWPERATERHVVLLTDDRRSHNPLAPVEPAAREQVERWARATQAHLHLWRCWLEFDDGNSPMGRDPHGPRRPPHGLPPSLVAGLFRNATQLRASDQGGALGAALAESLAAWTHHPKPVDFALLVDTSGVMGKSVRQLAAASDQLRAFLQGSRNRVAILAWDARRQKVVLPFSTAGRSITNALAGLRPSAGADAPEEVFAALNAARKQLRWAAGAERVVMVLTAADVFPRLDDELLDWSYRENLHLIWVEVTV